MTTPRHRRGFLFTHPNGQLSLQVGASRHFSILLADRAGNRWDMVVFHKNKRKKRRKLAYVRSINGPQGYDLVASAMLMRDVVAERQQAAQAARAAETTEVEA